MLSSVTPNARAMTGTEVLRMVVSSDSMKKATATNQGSMRLTAADKAGCGKKNLAARGRWVMFGPQPGKSTCQPSCTPQHDAVPPFWHVALRHRIRLDIGGEWSVVRGMRSAPNKPAQPVSPEAIAAEISRLSRLPLSELRAAWAVEFRKPRPKAFGGICY